LNKSSLFSFLFSQVSFDVEIAKHVNEHRREWQLGPSGDWRVTAIADDDRTRLNENHYELHQLHCCYVFLHPQKSLEEWPTSSSQVIEVHEHMNQKIHHAEECNLAAWIDLQPHPHCGRRMAN